MADRLPLKILLALAAAFALPARAGVETGQGLQDALSNPDRQVQAFLYVSGIFDTLTVLQGVRALPDGLSFCPPPAATTGQAMTVLRDYLAAHPGELAYPAPSLTIRAMALGWPCK